MNRIWLLGLLAATTALSQTGLVDKWTFDPAFLGGVSFSNQVRNLPAALVGPASFTTNPKAIALDGEQNYLRVAASMDTTQLPTRDLTAEAWVALTTGTRWGGIVGCVQDNSSFEKGWLLGYDETHFTMALSANGSLTYLTAASTFTLNRWYHVAGTYDGVTLKLYINGVLAASSTAENGVIDYAPAPYVIGCYLDDNESYPMHGVVREARVYNRALSATELITSYNSQTNLFPSSATPPPPPVGPASLALGPYAKFMTPNSVAIHWQTTESVPSVVEYGTSQILGSRAEEPSLKQTHELILTNLPRGRPCYYRVLLPSTATDIFTLEPDSNLTVASAPALPSPYPDDGLNDFYASLAQGILDSTGVREGYCLDYGCGDGRLAYELARRSNLYIVGVSEDDAAVRIAQGALRQAGLYGSRVTIQRTALDRLAHTKDIFNLAVSSQIATGGSIPGQATELVRVLRPARGVALLGLPLGTAGTLSNWSVLQPWLQSVPSSNATVAIDINQRALITRGVLTNAGQWSHTFGDPAQTANSHDQRVRGSAMKLQWFGQPGPRGMVDRQGRNPSPLVVADHLYVPGDDRLFGVDAYNGHVRWTLEIPGLRRVNIPRDSSNMCADDTSLYVAVRDGCWRIDGRSGDLTQSYGVVPPNGGQNYQWGYVASVEDRLYGSADKKGSAYTVFDGPAFWYDGVSGALIAQVCSDSFFCLSKTNGQTLWSRSAGVIINSSIALGGGRVYFVECRNPAAASQPTGRIGDTSLWQNTFLVALNERTGALIWEQPVTYPASPVVFFLCYANEKLVLDVSATRYRLFTYDARNGSLVWQKDHAWNRDNHGGHMYHPVIAQGAVYLEPYAYDLNTGAVVKSGLPSRGGCHTMCAAENTFLYIDWDYDKGSMYLWDLDTNQRRQMAGTRSSCWLSYISGSGMVLAPTASSGCTCRYPLQTSLGFAAP